MIPEISIIVPLYNEMEVFDELINRLNTLINNVEYNIEVLLIDDGSSDKTKQLMTQLGESNEDYIVFSYPKILDIKMQFLLV